MFLGLLVRTLTTPAAADRVVEHIFAEAYNTPAGEQAYLTKYFNAGIRRSVFEGGSMAGRYVTLSPAAQLLKQAFQKAYVETQRFAPRKAYHLTTNPQTAGMIAGGGFRHGHGTRGWGAYFYTDSTQAENYVPQIEQAPGQIAAVDLKVVIEVTIYSGVVGPNVFPTGGDHVTYEWPGTFVVKNPLVIFPTAVYKPGEKMANLDLAALAFL